MAKIKKPYWKYDEHYEVDEEEEAKADLIRKERC